MSSQVEIEALGLEEVVVITPKVFRDERGFFLESFNVRDFAKAGITLPFVQDNHSKSRQGTLRGLHAQREHPQGKLVRCIEGEIFDVAVDIRPDSPDFGEWTSAHLRADEFQLLWIPPGFAHGFCVLSEHADVEYKCTEPYDSDDEIAIAWNDPEIGIRWPVAQPLLSERDRKAPALAEWTPRLRRPGA